jgi:methylase of polypeptide subunit release factors
MTDIRWTESGRPHSARWRSETGAAPPERTVAAGSALTADAAFRMIQEGQGLLWRGEFPQALRLLQALTRRVEQIPAGAPPRTPAEAFRRHRAAQESKARLLGRLLIPFHGDHRIPLRRAPDVRRACGEVYGPAGEAYVASLRELQGLIGAHEWRKKGVEVPAIGGRIHPHYGVFAPIRGEYADLVAQAPLPAKTLAFDLGTGTGVLAAVLARRGVRRILASDADPRAVACARENLDRLGWGPQVETRLTDLFPEGRAPLIVFNPPWIPAQPSSSMERAVYDPESRVLKGFLSGLAAHLEPGGEGWLILSDLAERIGLRTRAEFMAALSGSGLKVVARLEVHASHPRTRDAGDLLHAARAGERTSLWRLAAV